MCVCLCGDAGGYVLMCVGGECVLCVGEVEMAWSICVCVLRVCGICGTCFVCLCDLYVGFVAC